jgi:hypothetical protein
VNNFTSTLIRIVLASLPVAVGHCADALDDAPGVGAVAATDQAATRQTATRALPIVARPRTLDLRLPDLQGLHVQDVPEAVAPSDSDEAEAVTLAAARLLPEESPETHPSVGGFAALYWAARHPAQAWRVLLPVQLDGGRAAEHATPETLTEPREIMANHSPTMLTPDNGGKGARRTQSGETT